MHRVIHRRGGRRRQYLGNGRRVLPGFRITRQPVPHQTHQIDAREPVIPNRFEEPLIGFVFLRLGLKHLELADQREILFELALTGHDFTLRHQGRAIQAHHFAEHAYAFRAQPNRIPGRERKLRQARARDP